MQNNEVDTVDYLMSVLQDASDKYYNEGESPLTDAEYDAMENQLREIDPDNTFFLGVGSEVRGEKVALPVTLGSLDQLGEGEVETWIIKNNLQDELLVITAKLDGTSALNAHAANGFLQISYSRGNGFEGADISRHMHKIDNVPKKVNESMSGLLVRCENIIPKSKWDEVNVIATEVGKRDKPYANARNFAGGQMNKKVAQDVFYKHSHIVAYEIVKPSHLCKREQLQILKDSGYHVASSTTMKGSEVTDEILQNLIKTWKQEDYEIDGIVIDVDDPAKRATMTTRESSLNPGFAKKYKVGCEDNKAVAKVVAVHWKASKHGYLKPRVEIEPVDLVGVTITYATGFNAKFIKENGIGPGAEINIVRSGDVIPYITDVVKSVDPSLPEGFGELEWTKGNVDLVMMDEHEDVQFQKFKHFFTKLDVAHAGDGNLQKMFDSGITDPIEAVTLTEKEWKVVGDSAGTKIFNSLKAKLNPVKVEVLAAASGCFDRGIGERKLKPVVDAFGCIPGDRSRMELMSIEGIQSITADKIIIGADCFINFMNKIDTYFTIEAPKEKITEGDLIGQYFVFTGVRDKELQAEIEAQGGEVGSSMSKVTILVAKDPNSTSGKAQKARDKGIKIVSHQEAKEMV